MDAPGTGGVTWIVPARPARRGNIIDAPRYFLATLLAILLIGPQASTASASIGRPDFTSSFRSYLLGDDPRSVAIADLNGDGTPDLICAGRDSATILLGAATGVFEVIQKFPVQGPYPAAVGDVDGDGHLDIAFADPAAGHVVVFRGDGTGRVDDGTAYAAGTAPRSAHFADLNRDGKLDLVSSNPTGIAIRLGTGAGSFGAESDIAVAGGPALVLSGDLNGDGTPDLVVGGAAIAILIGNGDGTFGALATVPVAASQLALSDVSGDGHLDLVLPGDSVAVWYGAGDGTFPAHIKLRRPAFRRFESVGVGDVNRDGIPDIIAAAPGSDYEAFPPPNQAIAIFLGFGQGAFYPEITTPAAGAPTNLAIGDLNGDGSSDLVVTNVAARVVSVHLCRGDGTFGSATDFACGAGPYAIETADFNRDGQLDLATVHYGPTVSLLLGRGAGDFGPATSVPLGSGAVALKAADMNQDACPDLVVARRDQQVQTLIGRCDGSLQGAAPASVGEFGSDLVALDVADFNADGLPDAVVAHYGAVSLVLGTGDGSFAPPHLLDGNAIGAILGAVIAGDFNGDGDPDVAYVSSSSSISVRLAHGDGSFGASVGTAVSHTVLAMACGDLDGDGKLDIVTVGPRSGNVFLGRGDGTFAPASEFQLPRDPVEAHLLDLDSDAVLDLVTVSTFSNLISVLHGQGDGTFGPPECFGAGIGSGSLVGGDFDGDGRGDLAVANFSTNSISVLLNRTAGAGPLPARAFFSNPTALVVGAGKAEVCVNVEPVGQAFSRADVGPTNPVLRSDGTGSATSITGYFLAPAASDADGNGIPDFPVCFRRGDLARLFDGVRGRASVEATLQGPLTNGRTFRAMIAFNVTSAGGPLHATLAPNPANPFSILSFSTTAAGWVQVDLFDAGGRLVHTERGQKPAGYQAYVLDGRNRSGGRIASGVYLLRIKAEHDGQQLLRLVMLR